MMLMCAVCQVGRVGSTRPTSRAWRLTRGTSIASARHRTGAKSSTSRRYRRRRVRDLCASRSLATWAQVSRCWWAAVVRVLDLQQV